MPISDELNERIKIYSSEFELTRVANERVRHLLETFEALFIDPPLDIFVANLNPPNTPTALGSMMVFSNRYAYEFKDFLSAYNWDITALSSAQYINVVVNNFDLRKATSQSIMSIRIEVNLPSTSNWGWSAVGRNCDFSLSMVQQYVLPNIRP